MDRVEPGEYNTHTHAQSHRRANASKSCLTLGWLKSDAILFIKTKNPGKLVN